MQQGIVDARSGFECRGNVFEWIPAKGHPAGTAGPPDVSSLAKKLADETALTHPAKQE
jgi:hypothetical protein